MDDAALPLGLAIVAIAAAVVLVHGLWRLRSLGRSLRRAWLELPRDADTGLLDRRVCVQRIAAEINRARRGDGSVWVSVVTVTAGDPVRFGRMLHDSLRVPELGFRIGEQVFCVTRPDLAPAAREDLLGRILGSAPRERLAVGEATWASASDGDAAALLGRAGAAVTEVRA